MWIGAWNLGLVRNRDDKALIAFVERQTGIQHLNWLRDAADAAKAVEALKKWMERDGGVDWSEHRFQAPVEKQPGFKIARAQFRKLEPDLCGTTRFASAFREAVKAASPTGDWIAVMNAFGKRVRALPVSKRKAA